MVMPASMCEDGVDESTLTSRNRGRCSTPLQTINRIRYNQRVFMSMAVTTMRRSLMSTSSILPAATVGTSGQTSTSDAQLDGRTPGWHSCSDEASQWEYSNSRSWLVQFYTTYVGGRLYGQFAIPFVGFEAPRVIEGTPHWESSSFRSLPRRSSALAVEPEWG